MSHQGWTSIKYHWNSYQEEMKVRVRGCEGELKSEATMTGFDLA